MTAAELEKIHVEVSKIIAETVKLNAETAKINASMRWYPLILIGGAVTVINSVTDLVVKLFGH